MIREVVGDIWNYPCDMRVVPTNMFVKRNGRAVMGAGLARQAATRYPDLPEVLGRFIERGGYVHVIRHDIIAFPTKYVWWEQSNTELIKLSTGELRDLILKMNWKTVAMPRVGCGNGGLRWGLVKPVLEEILGDAASHCVIVDNG